MTCHILQDLLPPFLFSLAMSSLPLNLVMSLPHECLTLHRQKQKFTTLIVQSHFMIKELFNFGTPLTIIIAIGKWNLSMLHNLAISLLWSFNQLVILLRSLQQLLESLITNLCLLSPLVLTDQYHC